MEKKFKELNEAQEVLSDPDKRKNTISTVRIGNKHKPSIRLVNRLGAEGLAGLGVSNKDLAVRALVGTSTFLIFRGSLW